MCEPRNSSSAAGARTRARVCAQAASAERPLALGRARVGLPVRELESCRSGWEVQSSEYKSLQAQAATCTDAAGHGAAGPGAPGHAVAGFGTGGVAVGAGGCSVRTPVWWVGCTVA